MRRIGRKFVWWRSRIIRRLIFAALVLIALDYFVFSFFRILQTADSQEPVKSDAIVVFSGDPSRIHRGFDLLARGFAKRLFVAGVDNAEDIDSDAKTWPELARCCVEFERTSQDTHEDAVAIAKWVNARKLGSIVVITTNIHMPRALAELAGRIPDVRITPIGVSTGLYDSHDWQHDPATREKLAMEGVKYIAVRFMNLAGQ